MNPTPRNLRLRGDPARHPTKSAITRGPLTGIVDIIEDNLIDGKERARRRGPPAPEGRDHRRPVPAQRAPRRGQPFEDARGRTHRRAGSARAARPGGPGYARAQPWRPEPPGFRPGS